MRDTLLKLVSVFDSKYMYADQSMKQIQCTKMLKAPEISLTKKYSQSVLNFS